MKKILTTCGYCGCGCNLYFNVVNEEIAGVTPKKNHPVSKGKLCVKGWQGFSFVRNQDRLYSPLVRQCDGSFKAVAWDEAYAYITDNLKRTVKQYGPKSFGAFSSARCTNEENYLFAKFTRAAIGSPNIDHCARL